MAPLLGPAARRHGSCCSGRPGRNCDDWSAAHRDWPETRRGQRHVEKQQWWREQGREDDAPDVED